MRPDEAFVARSLVQFLGGPSAVSATDGEDPPDLYLSLAANRVGVEVTRLSQFTFDPNGTFGNRATEDTFGVRVLDDLDAKLGPSLPGDVSLLLGIEVPVLNAARFRKFLTAWVREVATAPVPGTLHERDIDGSNTSISVIPERPTGKRIAGFVVNKNSSADILLNARLILEDRIQTKSTRCSGLTKPLWLALLNDYWLADGDSYDVASRQLKLSHCFDRILIVSDHGVVSELVVGA
jgi:hypothetical protein